MIAISGFGTACMTNNPGAAINRRIANPFDASALIPVFFATNRVPISLKPACDDSYYGVRNSREMRYGACEINVPKIHTVGSLATGSSDRDRSFKTGALQEAQSGGLIRKIASTPGDEVLLFVHGFNVKFEEALLRAAQIAYDTKFQGATVLFTWPAGAGEDSLSSVLIHRTYAANQTNARDSVALFAQFVRDLRSTGKTVHILVHSMGHQIVLPALAQLADESGGKQIGELILNAPDFPAADLQQLAPRLQKLSRRVTLYCSPGDNALVASRQINSNHRAGLCGKVPGIDVINVNELADAALGHGYYSERAVLTDVYQVLLGVDVERRLFIRRSDPGGGENYILRK